MITSLRNTPDDCKWLRETHLRGSNLEFRSFYIAGNVDFPDMLTIYGSTKPTSFDEPIAIFKRTQFGLTLQPKTSVVLDSTSQAIEKRAV